VRSGASKLAFVASGALCVLLRDPRLPEGTQGSPKQGGKERTTSPYSGTCVLTSGRFPVSGTHRPSFSPD